MKESTHMHTDFRWINLDEVRGIARDRLVLFGAGKGSEEFMAYLDSVYPETRVVAVADNDRSLQGQMFYGVRIIDPKRIPEIDFDKIAVTSISGRDVIARQLRGMGYRETTDFLLVGRYPYSHQRNLETVMEAADFGISLERKVCLHIGPGGFLGLEVLLFCLGAERVHTIDKNAFGIHYPDLTPRRNDYMALREILHGLSITGCTNGKTFNRFNALFIWDSNRLSMDTGKIDYRCPMDVCRLDFLDDSFDIILSFGVLEHVENPGAAVSEMQRVLKPGGTSIHRIVTRDHRCYSRVGGFDPFSFREYSEREWENISRKTFYQNRLLPVDWKRLLEEAENQTIMYRVHEVVPIEDTVLSRYHKDFHRYSREELSEIDCTIFAKKKPIGCKEK